MVGWPGNDSWENRNDALHYHKSPPNSLLGSVDIVVMMS